jgi:hypothetical protein
MNSTLYLSTAEKSSCVHTDALLGEDRNTTVPMAAVQPAYKPLDEEALHTSFEEAISDRLVALHGRLKHLSTSSLSSSHDPMLPSTRPFVTTPVTQTATCPSSRLGKRWQGGITLIGLALLCMLLGVDLMGLLVLHMR